VTSHVPLFSSLSSSLLDFHTSNPLTSKFRTPNTHNLPIFGQRKLLSFVHTVETTKLSRLTQSPGNGKISFTTHPPLPPPSVPTEIVLDFLLWPGCSGGGRKFEETTEDMRRCSRNGEESESGDVASGSRSSKSGESRSSPIPLTSEFDRNGKDGN
jgi:hypothetical protein